MRIMAFDYGTKRIGIAVTDPLKLIATALDTIHSNAIIPYLKDYLAQEQVETFVVGMPKQMDGSDSQSAMHVRGFIRLLQKTFPTIQIHTIDERFTSKMASATIAQSGLKRSKRQEKSLVDSVAAVIILQGFMESSQFTR